MEFVLFMIKNDKEINHNLIRRIQNLKNTAKEYLYKFKFVNKIIYWTHFNTFYPMTNTVSLNNM